MRVVLQLFTLVDITDRMLLFRAAKMRNTRIFILELASGNETLQSISLIRKIIHLSPGNDTALFAEVAG